MTPLRCIPKRTLIGAIAMTGHGDGEQLGAGGDDGDPGRVEIILPRARSIVWLGIKVYLIVALGLPPLATTVAFLCIAIITAVR